MTARDIEALVIAAGGRVNGVRLPCDPRAKRRPAVQREAAFQKAVIQYAQMMGWRVAWFRRVRVQRRNGSVYYETPAGANGVGWPDLAMTREGRFVVAELKVPPNKPTDEQKEWLRAFEKAGISAFVWEPKDWPEIEKTLQK